jgi:hypothetical protein
VHQVRLPDRHSLGFGHGGGTDARDQLSPSGADFLDARRGGGTLGVGHPRSQRARKLPERRLRVGDDPERDRVAPSDFPRIVVDLHHAKTAREGRAFGVEEPVEDVGADDQHRVAVVESLPHAGRGREQAAPPERVVAREVRPPIHRLAVDPRP